MDFIENTHKMSVVQGGVLIYIDNSNIWINTMHHSAKQLKFINDIQQDQRIRVNISQMVSTAAANRPIIRCVLYGSEPPPVRAFWNNVKDLNVDVQVTKRSTYNNREREVDQNINLDIGEDIVIHREHAKYNGTIILFTGDGGMSSAVKKAIQKYNWNVEIWSYSHSLARVYIEEFKEEPKLQICLLDSYFDKFAYYTLEWRDQIIPAERSFVITFNNLHRDLRNEIMKKFVKAATKLLRLPMSGRFIYVKKPELSMITTAHLALVCNVNSQILKEDSRSDQAPKHVLEHHNNPKEKKEITFQFNNENWEKALEIIYGSSEYSSPVLLQNVKKGLEIMLSDILNKNSNGEIKFTPKYDFNKDVFHTAETCLLSLNHYGEKIEGLEELIIRHRPIIRSYPQFIQDLRLEDIHESRYEAPSKDDVGEDGFHVVTHKKNVKKKFQKYSESCKYGFRCKKGFQCTFSHNDKEIEFFKIQPESNIRMTYKYKDCEHFNGIKGSTGCKYKGPLSYMCPYAHGTYCMTCKCDIDGGHDLHKCPETPSMIQRWLLNNPE